VEGEAPLSLAAPWGRKPKFAVNGSRSCAELALAAKSLAETGAPIWAVEAFEGLRAANGGTLRGCVDVFAWREPGRVRFDEAKVGPDRIKPTQLRFVELALRFHRLEEFTIIEVAGPSLRGAPGHVPRSAWEAVERIDGSQWLTSSARTARAFCDGPRETCCVSLTAWPGRTSRKRS
jgi:hypothetical protein